MAQTETLEKIKKFVEQFIEKWTEAFLVDINIDQANKITVLVDADNGMDIDKCAVLNRALYKYVEEHQLFGEKNFSMEVSSPGIDRPLTGIRQFRKNIGREVEVLKKEDNSKLKGRLIEVSDEGIRLEIEEKKKKKETEKEFINIPYKEIQQAKVLVSF